MSKESVKAKFKQYLMEAMDDVSRDEKFWSPIDEVIEEELKVNCVSLEFSESPPFAYVILEGESEMIRAPIHLGLTPGEEEGTKFRETLRENIRAFAKELMDIAEEDPW